MRTPERPPERYSKPQPQRSDTVLISYALQQRWYPEIYVLTFLP